MSADSTPHSSYFSDRCPRTIFGNETARPCRLKLGHPGECLPIPLPQSKIVPPHSSQIDIALWRRQMEGKEYPWHLARCTLALNEIERLRGIEEQHAVQARAFRAIHFNADSWHGDDEAKGRALNVIAAWALHPESVPEGVGE